MKHENATVEVKGIDTFRKTTLITTMIGSTISVILIAIDRNECEGTSLRNATIVCLSVQLSIFSLLLLHYIHCGCLLRKLGGWLGIFYFILTGLMTWC